MDFNGTGEMNSTVVPGRQGSLSDCSRGSESFVFPLKREEMLRFTLKILSCFSSLKKCVSYLTRFCCIFSAMKLIIIFYILLHSSVSVTHVFNINLVISSLDIRVS